MFTLFPARTDDPAQYKIFKIFKKFKNLKNLKKLIFKIFKQAVHVEAVYVEAVHIEAAEDVQSRPPRTQSRAAMSRPPRPVNRGWPYRVHRGRSIEAVEDKNLDGKKASPGKNTSS